MEYRGVDTKTKKQLFIQGPFPEGTNNIGEFLALVHGLATSDPSITQLDERVVEDLLVVVWELLLDTNQVIDRQV